MIADPWFYVLAVPAILLVGISKVGFGGGLGVLAVPMMAIVVAPPTAAAVMLPILCVMDLIGVWAYRRSFDLANLRIMVPAAILGIGFGALTFGYMDQAMIRILIGLIAVIFTLNYWLGGKSAAEARGRNRIKGSLWSAVSGFTSFLAHAGGPPVNVYLLPQRMDMTLFVGTKVVFFIIVNFVKLIPYAWLGQLHAGNLATSLVLIPLAPVGVGLGLWLHRRIDNELFYRICYVILFLVGIRLLYDGVSDLL